MIKSSIQSPALRACRFLSASYQARDNKTTSARSIENLVKEEYYSTLFHEMVYSTGHKDRLNRQGVAKNNITFGGPDYSKEELIAEMGATILYGMAGINQTTMDNSASYMKAWLSKLKKIIRSSFKPQDRRRKRKTRY